MLNKISISKELKIRQAEIKDAQKIAILSEQLGYSLTNQQVKQRLAKIQSNDAHIFYVATLADEDVIGWVHAYICDLIIMPTQALLFGLVVDENYRHNGIGHALMQKIEQWAYLAGCEGVILRSNVKRQEAHLFYEKIGYTTIKQSLTFHKKLL